LVSFVVGVGKYQMPILQPCASAGCSTLVPSGRCTDHQREVYRTKKKAPDRSKDYDWDWRKLREHHIRREPFCRVCMESGKPVAAEEVDHIEPLAKAPERRLDPANIQSLCRDHHHEKTAMENGRHIVKTYMDD
jgi:5-methylcytosine-specific restriction protein A